MKCCRCGAEIIVGFYCDEHIADGPWCVDCFEPADCFEKHGEGCATKVFQGKEEM